MSTVFWGPMTRSRVVENARRKIECMFSVTLEIGVLEIGVFGNNVNTSEATYQLHGDRIDRNRAKSYIQALTREGEFVEKTVYPRNCDQATIERVEKQTSCVLERRKEDEYTLRGSRLSVTVALTLLEEIAKQTEPQTPQKSNAASRRLSTALEQTLNKTNHKSGHYSTTSDAVKRAIACCILQDQDERTDVILIDDDSEVEEDVICLNETCLNEDFAYDGDDDVIIIETPREPDTNMSVFFSENTTKDQEIENEVEAVTSELGRMATPSHCTSRSNLCRPSAAVRPLNFEMPCSASVSNDRDKIGHVISEMECKIDKAVNDRRLSKGKSEAKNKDAHEILNGTENVMSKRKKKKHEATKRKLSLDSSHVDSETYTERVESTKKRNKRRRIRRSISVTSDSGTLDRDSEIANAGKKIKKKKKKTKTNRNRDKSESKDMAKDAKRSSDEQLQKSNEKRLRLSRWDLTPNSFEQQKLNFDMKVNKSKRSTDIPSNDIPTIDAKQYAHSDSITENGVKLSRWELAPKTFEQQTFNFEMKMDKVKFGSQQTDNHSSYVIKKPRDPIVISVSNDSRSVRISNNSIQTDSEPDAQVKSRLLPSKPAPTDSLSGNSSQRYIETEVKLKTRLLPPKPPLVAASQDTVSGSYLEIFSEPEAPVTTGLLPPQPPPAAASKGSSLRYIVIDGSNVAMCHGGNSDVFSCRGIRLCVEFFKRRGHRLITVFLPHWRKCRPAGGVTLTHRYELDALEREGLLVYTPSRKIGNKLVACYDDRFIVELAEREEGVIVSNDQYRDLQLEKRSWRKVIEERLLMYTFVRDQFMVPEDPLGRMGPTLNAFLMRAPPRVLPRNHGNDPRNHGNDPWPVYDYKYVRKNPHIKHLQNIAGDNDVPRRCLLDRYLDDIGTVRFQERL